MLALLIVLAAIVGILCLFVVALHRRVQRLEERVHDIDKDLEDAWVVVIPKDIDHEWAWPEREVDRAT